MSSVSGSEALVPHHQKCRDEGSGCYRTGDYAGAVDAYSRALHDPAASSAERALLHNNRAAAYLMLQRPGEALSDCDAAVRLAGEDMHLVSKALARKSTALKQLGRLEAAIEALAPVADKDKAYARDIDVLRSAKSRLEQIRNLTNGQQKLRIIDGIVSDLGCSFYELNMLRLDALVELKRTEEAFNLSNSLLRSVGASDVELLFARAKILYVRGDLETAVKHLQQAMRADPDNHKCRGLLRRFKEIDELKRSGDVSFREGCFEQAVAHWSACIALDPTTAAVAAKVLFNRGTAFSKLRQYEEAVKDFSAALELEPAYTKALIKRADCNHTLGTPESIERALGDYEKASQLVSDDEALAKELKQKLAQAKVSLKRSKRKDLYAILGVPRDAADDEVKRAYKKAALRFHPDKQAGKSEEEQAAATASFKGVSEAYEVLSDADKRRLYDDGVEVEEIDQHQEHGHQHSHGHGGMDPNEMFRMFMEQQRARGGGDW